MDAKNVNNDFDSTNILLFFIRWWKQLAIVCFSAAVLAAIFSSPFFITPLFESTVVMFPAKSTSLSRAVFGSNVDFLEYGDVDDAERLLQVLGSTAVRDRIVERFDLFDHYEIPEDSKFRNTNLRKIYSGNISSSRTPYGAVEIKVRDKDPVMAADIANELSALSDSIQNEIRQERALMAYRVAVQRYENIRNEITLTQDSMRLLMQGGIYDYEAQVRCLPNSWL
jgi:capsular polysaccharide biosynthesis protein